MIPKSTAHIPPLLLTTTTLLLLLLLLLSLTTAIITDEEIDVAASSLRAHGYTLFPNAIATSDLRPLLLNSNNSSFTIFSPPDSLLFSLDFSSPAHYYVRSLLQHVSPTRLPISVLRSHSYANTLVPGHRLLVEDALVISNGTVFGSVSLDGVRVSVPDLFVGSDIVVHGLEGILVSEFESDYEKDDGFFSSPAPDVSGEEAAPANAPGPTFMGSAGEKRRRDTRKKKHKKRHESRRRWKQGRAYGGGDVENPDHINFEKWDHDF